MKPNADRSSPRERLEAVERTLRMHLVVSGLSCVVSFGALALASSVMFSATSTDRPPLAVVPAPAADQHPFIDPEELNRLNDRVSKLEAKPERFLVGEWETQELQAAATNDQPYKRWSPTLHYVVVEVDGEYVRHGRYDGAEGHGQYEFGKRVGRWINLHSDKTRDRPWVREEGEYRNGKRVGPWKFYSDYKGRNLLREELYADDKPVTR